MGHVPTIVTETLTPIRQYAEKLVQEHDTRPLEAHEQAVFETNFRMLSLFDAVQLLLEAGMPEEALFQCRTMLDESIFLLQVSKAHGPTRVGLLISRARRDLKTNVKLLKGAINDGHSTPFSLKETDQMLTQRLKKLDLYAESYSVPSVVEFLDDQDAAAEYGTRDDIWFRSHAHQQVHGHEGAGLLRTYETPNGFRLRLRTTDPHIISQVFCFAGRSLLRSTKSASEILGWGEQSASVKKHLDALDRLAAIFGTSPPGAHQAP